MTDTSENIARRFPIEARRLRFSLAAILVCLGLGLFAPIITLEKFYFFENTVSIISGLLELIDEGQYLLFIIIALFSIALPVLKLFILNKLLSPKLDNYESFQKHLDWMHHYGKWSMLDVFVVAVLLAAVKLGSVADVQLHYGIYLFAAAVLLTMLVTARVVKLSDTIFEKTS
ncbi:MAG: paraquat-inducible protein A [Sulfuriflexus sp.]|nr:paraquat-inducible protein A [Sulfuriflexus sp.]